MNKAKSLDMIDLIITSAADINLQVHTIPIFRDYLGLDKVKEVDVTIQSQSKKSGNASKNK